MHTQNRYTQQIDVLELILETIDTHTNTLIDKIQIIENTLYHLQHKQPINLKS